MEILLYKGLDSWRIVSTGDTATPVAAEDAELVDPHTELLQASGYQTISVVERLKQRLSHSGDVTRRVFLAQCLPKRKCKLLVHQLLSFTLR